MSLLEPQFPAKVCEERCSTCVFGVNSPISAERMRELADGWKKRGHQICHHHGVVGHGEDVWCRGFWETQITDVLQALFIAMGYVVFVPCDPEEPLDV